MGIRGGSEGDPTLKLGDPNKMHSKKWYKMRGSNPTTYPLYIINKEMRARDHLEEKRRTRWSLI